MADVLPVDDSADPPIVQRDNLYGALGLGISTSELGEDTQQDLEPDLRFRTFFVGDGTESRGDKPKLMIVD